jgi:uncharacterized protein YbjT (DUF2867 family)
LVSVGVAHRRGAAAGAFVVAPAPGAGALRDIDGVVVRATGFHSAYASLLPMARRGWLADIGAGQTRSYPIDERDLAAIVADAVSGEGPRELAAGGPEVMTRAEIFELVAAHAGRRVRMVRLPVWLASMNATLFRAVHPRMGQFAKFAVLLARHSVIADARGTRTLRAYLNDDTLLAAA